MERMDAVSAQRGRAEGAGRVTAVCVVHEIIPNPGETPDVTAIDKRPLAGRVEAAELGLAGDTQVDRRYHGGPEQALYAYADEDAAFWATELGRDIPPGLFGENLRTHGLEVSRAEVGERWRLGDGDGAVVVEVTMPRTPCMTFQKRMDEQRWVKRFTKAGLPGAYLRVVAPGTLGAGDAVRVEHRPGHGVTVADLLAGGGASALRLLEAHEAGAVELGAKVLRVVRRRTWRLRAAADRA